MEFDKSIIGMVHVQALPGTPRQAYPITKVIDKALSDAVLLEKAGTDAVMIENMHDRPYLNRDAGPEITAAMTAVAIALRKELKVPLGIQILAGANKAALGVALAAGLDFIRAEGFVFGHMADEGMMNSDAAELMRYRKQIGAGHIQILTDIKKKHASHALTADVTVAETAKAAEFFLSDGVIVTGASTGMKPSAEDLQLARKAVKIPVLIGSGIDATNIKTYWPLADAFIVGSSLKFEGNWENEVDQARVKEFMGIVNKLRSDGGE